MRTNWIECPRGDVRGQWAAIYITMNKKGYISMSRRTYERLDEPKAFNLYFDKVNSRIGLKPTALAARNAFPVAKQGRHGGRVIRAWRLMQEFGIDLPETMQFDDPEIDQEGILILDLRTARISKRAHSQRKSAA